MVEVLIAGAGPAGAVAATVLARAGCRVLLLDRARFPRDKLCGDTLNPGTVADLQRLGLGTESLARALPVDGMILTAEDGVVIRGSYPPGTRGRAIRRRDLDNELLTEAIRAGARFHDATLVRSALIESAPGGRRVRGATVRAGDGRTLRLLAPVTIAADGRRSRLTFGLGLAWQPRRPRRWAVGRYFEGVSSLSSYGEMHVRRGHYIGVAPLPDGTANACLVTDRTDGFDDPENRLACALAGDSVLRERFAAARPVGRAVTVGPLAVDASRAVIPGLLVAGDAAGFIDPMTGDGLRFAIRGGELAARAAIELLEHGDETVAERLPRWRRAEFGAKWRFNRALRALVGSDHGLRLAAAAATVAPGVFQRMIAVAGDARRR